MLHKFLPYHGTSGYDVIYFLKSIAPQGTVNLEIFARSTHLNMSFKGQHILVSKTAPFLPNSSHSQNGFYFTRDEGEFILSTKTMPDYMLIAKGTVSIVNILTETKARITNHILSPHFL